MMLWLLGALGLTGSGIGLAALLGGGPAMLLGLKWLWSWLGHATFLQVVCVVLIGALAVDHIALLASHRHAAKVEKQLTACTAARQADQQSYKNAQQQAATDNKAQVQKIEQQSEGVSTDERQSYLSDLAKLRADNQRLRAQAASAASGAAGSAGASPPPATASGTDGDGLHLSPDEHLQAQEIELRLMHLQSWVLRQLAIDPNAEPSH